MRVVALVCPGMAFRHKGMGDPNHGWGAALGHLSRHAPYLMDQSFRVRKGPTWGLSVDFPLPDGLSLAVLTVQRSRTSCIRAATAWRRRRAGVNRAAACRSSKATRNVSRFIIDAEDNWRRGGGIAKPVAAGVNPGTAGLGKRAIGARRWNALARGDRLTRLCDGACKVARRLGPLAIGVVLAKGFDVVEGLGGEGYAGDACRTAIRRSSASASASISRHRASVSMA